MMDRNKSLQEPTLPENLRYDLFCVVVKIAKSKFACTIGVDKLQPDTLTCMNVKKSMMWKCSLWEILLPSLSKSIAGCDKESLTLLSFFHLTRLICALG